MSERESNLQPKKPDQAAQVHRAPEAEGQVEQGNERREAFNGIQRNFGNKVASGVARSAATAQTATPNFGLDKAEYANYKSRADNGFEAIDKGKNSKQITAAIEEAHRLFGLPISEIRDVICIESSGNPSDKANKNSTRSASGLMQVTGETWEEINKQLNRKHKALTSDHKGKEELFETLGQIKDLPFEGNWQNIRYNVLFATSYIMDLKTKFGTVGNTLMSYNAGGGTITVAKALAEARAQKDPAAALKEVFAKYPGTKTRTNSVGSAVSLEDCFNKYGKGGTSKSVQAAENLKPAIDYYGVWAFYKNKKGLSESESVEKKYIETSNYAKGSDLIMSLDPKKDTAGGGTAPVATPVTAPSAPVTAPAAPKGPAKHELSAAAQQTLLAEAYGHYKSIKQGDALAERLAYIIFNNMYPSRNSRSDKFGYPFSPDVTPADGALYKEYQALKSTTSAYVQQKSQPAAEKPAPQGPAASQPVSAPGGTTEKPATPTGKPATAPVKDTGDKIYDQVRKAFPDGVTVSIMTNFEMKGNNAEFGRQASIFAKNENPVAIVGGQLVLGNTTKINGMDDAVAKVNAIHSMLVAKDKQHGGSGDAAFTKIKNLSVFTHGIANAVDLSPGGGQFPLRETNVGQFVGSIAGSLNSDVRVQLFSCSTARNNDKEGYSDWAEHRKGVRTGDTSFANEMSKELNKRFKGEASVYAHSTAGHTTNNYAARVFGKDAGGGNGGLQIFELMYSDAFIKSEAARLKRDAGTIREEMWKHYKTLVTAGATLGGAPISHEMFANIEHATQLLQNDWLSKHGGKPVTVAPAPISQAPKPEAPKQEAPAPQAPKPEAPKQQAPAPQAPAPVAKTLDQSPARIELASEAIEKAVKAGEKDKYELANAGWYALHPSRKDTAIKKGETTFMAEYNYILNNLVPKAQHTPATPGATPVTTTPPAKVEPVAKPPVKTEPVAKPPQQQTPAPAAPVGANAGRVEKELSQFFQDFSHIKVPVEHGGKTIEVSVRPPYHINVGRRQKAAAAARAANPSVSALLKPFKNAAKTGKASIEDIRGVLTAAAKQGLIAKGPNGYPGPDEMRAWLGKYGVSTDCSGFVSQAINKLKGKTKFAPGDNNSGMLSGLDNDFNRIMTPRNLQPGDTMYMKPPTKDSVGHIRIIISVDVVKHNGKDAVRFRTGESRGSDGLSSVYWLYPNPESFAGLVTSNDGNTGWKANNTTHYYGRVKGGLDKE